MSIVAFNFTKIAGERKTGPAGKLSIKNQTGITDVKEQALGNQKALLFSFKHTILYEPGFATITMEGEVLVLSNEQEAKDTVATFKKNKTFNPVLTQKVMNAVLNRVSVQALIMARDLNIPAPIKLPRVEIQAKPVDTKTKEMKKK